MADDGALVPCGFNLYLGIMLWLQNPPWARWAIALLITFVAVWAEFRPDQSRDHPFATERIAAGEALGPHNTESRSVPANLLTPVADGGFATRAFDPGEPITDGGVSTRPIAAPEGWWSVEVDLPAGADLGGEAQLVLLDGGLVVPGRVTAIAGDDPLSTGAGSVAIPPGMTAAVASAVASGRVVVLVKTR